jgi:hypothetical protein
VGRERPTPSRPRPWSASKSPSAHATPLPGLRGGTRLAHRAAPPQRPTPVVRSEGGGGAHPPVPFGLPALPQQPELHSLRLLHYYAVGDEVPLGRLVRTLLRQPPAAPGAAQIRARVPRTGRRPAASSPRAPASSLSCRCHGPTAGAATPSTSSSRSTACF